MTTSSPLVSSTASASPISASLSIRQRVAQCVMVRVSADAYFDDDAAAQQEYRRRLRKLIRDEGIGGVCVFQGDAVQTALMLKELQNLALYSPINTAYAANRLPLLVSADLEHGLAMRLVGGTAFPHAANLGAADNEETTRRVAEAIAKEALTIGIGWNFAPVCDITSDKANFVIGNRAFGETADLVARHARQYVEGLQGLQGLQGTDTDKDGRQKRMLACAKHFPGHGATSVDSHVALPVLTVDKQTLYERELKPFREAIAAGVRSVMIGHIAVPCVEASAEASANVSAESSAEAGGEHIPASLSKAVITGLLREELGFTGLVVTDALDMNAVAEYIQRYHTEPVSIETVSREAACRAFAAGADVILLPPDPFAAIEALTEVFTEAITSGVINEISEERLDASVQRIIEAKQWLGLQEISKQDASPQNASPQDDSAHVTPELVKQHQLMALDAASAGLRWFDGESFEGESFKGESGKKSSVVPVSQFQQIAAFAIVEEAQTLVAANFFRYLAQAFQGDCDFGFIDDDISDDDLFAFADGTRNAEMLIFAVFMRSQMGDDGKVYLPSRVQAAAERLADGRPVLVVQFGNPYLRETFFMDSVTSSGASRESIYLCTYSSSDAALGAAAAALNRD